MKIDLSRFLETQDAKKTKAGQELSQTLDYLASFTEVVVRSLKNNLDFANNFNAVVATVDLVHNVDQIVNYANGRGILGIIPIKALTKTDFVTSLGWYFDDNGDLKLNATFRNAPTEAISCTIVILYV